MLVIAVTLTGFVGLLLLMVAKWRQTHAPKGTFAGGFHQSSGSKLRLPPSEFFNHPASLQLIESAIRGDRASVQSAKAAGANVNLRGKQGVTPLILTLLNFSLPGFKLMLEAGADPNVHAENGDTAVMLAAIMPDVSYLQSALRYGGKLDDRDSHGRSPLMLSASHARSENAQMLITSGADVNATDPRGDSPLIHAMQASRPQQAIVQLLLERSARVETTNLAGLTARDYASAFDDPKLLAWFNHP